MTRPIIKSDRVNRRPGNGLDSFITGSAILTSSELIKAMTAAGFSEQNARQYIRRHLGTDGIWRSESLKLPRGERLFTRKSFAGKPDFFIAAAKKLQSTNRHGLARCLDSLGRLHVVHKIEVMRLLAVSPTASDKGSELDRFYEGELNGLKELGVRLIHPATELESLVSPTIPEDENPDAIAAIGAARVRKSALLARILTDRLRRQNMLSWNRIELSSIEQPYTVFNNQVFSSYGFSYLSPLTRWRSGSEKPIPCPVLIDSYDDKCSLLQVQSFAERIKRATIRGKSRLSSLAVIAARDFDKDAWMDARRQGFITISFRQIFGDEALNVMVSVEELLHGLNQADESNSEQKFESFSDLLVNLKANPIVATLRSIGFEALCGLILRSNGYEQVELGRIVPWKQTTRDIDVFGITGDKQWVIECKAHHSKKSLSSEDVTRFFTESLPALKAWLHKNKRQFSSCTAEIWTTGHRGKDADRELYKLKRPKNDQWDIKRMDQFLPMIPNAIRRRSRQLLESIAIAETDDSNT